MTADDVPDVDALGMRTLFGDLPGDVDQEARRVWQYGRLGHLVETDPGGAFVLEDGEGVCGVSIALVREHVWGLSLFAIDERMRGRGHGTDLLRASLAYGESSSCEGWIILSSEHPAAMRLYAVTARLDVLPCVAAVGIPVLDQAPPQAARVEDAGAGGVDLADAIGREVRGAGHGLDIAAALRFGARLLTFEDRAFALVREGQHLAARRARRGGGERRVVGGVAQSAPQLDRRRLLPDRRAAVGDPRLPRRAPAAQRRQPCDDPRAPRAARAVRSERRVPLSVSR